MERFERVWRGRSLRCLDCAEPAAPGACISQEHDRAGATVPALADVGTLSLLADRVKIELLERGLELFILLPAHQGQERERTGAGVRQEYM